MEKKICHFNISKLIASLVIFFILLGIAKDIYISNLRFLTYYELVLSVLNETHSLLFAISFILMFISGLENPKNQLSSKAAFPYLRQTIMSALLMICLLITASLVYILIRRGFEGTLINAWTYNSGFSMTGRSPIVCLSIAIILFGLRCIFLFILISLINVLTQKPYWGFWAVLFICFIDFRFYNQTHIADPLYILPVEHTRILYTSAFSDPMGIVTRGSYIISILYWIILILFIYEIMEYAIKRRRKHEECIHKRN